MTDGRVDAVIFELVLVQGLGYDSVPVPNMSESEVSPGSSRYWDEILSGQTHTEAVKRAAERMRDLCAPLEKILHE